MKATNDAWREVAAGVKVMSLTLPVRLLIPPLLVASVRRSAIGFSFERGRSGAILGCALVIGALAGATALYPVAGAVGVLLPLWLLGGSGVAILVGSAKPIAFVKPLCGGCRLLPVILEHEAIHISGVESDRLVWEEMRTRHTCESLSLKGDPRVCWFCPIPKRLEEH